MSRRGRRFRRSHANIRMSYEGVGEMLNSEDINRFMDQVASKAAGNASPDSNATWSEPRNPAKHNRARRYVSFEYENPYERNHEITRILRGQ